MFSHMTKLVKKEKVNGVTPLYVKCFNVLYLCVFKTVKGYTKLIVSSDQLRSKKKS